MEWYAAREGAQAVVDMLFRVGRRRGNQLVKCEAPAGTSANAGAVRIERQKHRRSTNAMVTDEDRGHEYRFNIKRTPEAVD